MLPKILVTGGSGYIGSFVCEHLEIAGFTPVVVDNFTTGHYKSHLRRLVHRADLRDQKALGKIFSKTKIAGIIHMAGSAYVSESMRNPMMYFDNNVESSRALIEVALQHNVRFFVFSSSCATYGLPETKKIQESQTQSPISPYGWSKLLVEQMFESLNQIDELTYTSLRYFNAAGASANLALGESHNPETHVVPLLVKSMVTNSPFRVFGSSYPTNDGTAVRDFTHVDDIAAAHVLALERMFDGGDSISLNLGTGIGTSIWQLIDYFKNRGLETEILLEEPRIGDPPFLVADSTLSREHLGWIPRNDINQILESELLWQTRNSYNF